MSEGFRAVLFDMDGLIIDSERIYLRAQREAATQLGFEPPDELLNSFVGLEGEKCIRMMEEAAGPAFPMDDYRVLWQELWAEIVRSEGLSVKPGLRPLLAWLDDNDIPRALVTSTHAPKAQASLRSAGLQGEFAHVITGDEVPRNKPAPDIYLRGSGRLGVEPGRCIALEDSDAGAISASTAGMRVVMIPDVRQPSAEARATAYAVLPSLVEAMPLLQEWLGAA